MLNKISQKSNWVKTLIISNENNFKSNSCSKINSTRVSGVTITIFSTFTDHISPLAETLLHFSLSVVAQSHVGGSYRGTSPLVKGFWSESSWPGDETPQPCNSYTVIGDQWSCKAAAACGSLITKQLWVRSLEFDRVDKQCPTSKTWLTTKMIRPQKNVLCTLW